MPLRTNDPHVPISIVIVLLIEWKLVPRYPQSRLGLVNCIPSLTYTNELAIAPDPFQQSDTTLRELLLHFRVSHLSSTVTLLRPIKKKEKKKRRRRDFRSCTCRTLKLTFYLCRLTLSRLVVHAK